MSQFLDRSVSQLLDRSVLQLCVTAQFYLENKGNYILEVCRRADPKEMKRRKREGGRERERESPRGERHPLPTSPLPFGSSFYVFSPPPGPAVCKFGQAGLLFDLPEVLIPVLRPSFVLFSQVFPSLSFSHRHSGILFPILTTKQNEVVTFRNLLKSPEYHLEHYDFLMFIIVPPKPERHYSVFKTYFQRDIVDHAAAAAAKSLQSCPTLCDSIDGSPSGSSILGILQARTLEWVAISFSNA